MALAAQTIVKAPSVDPLREPPPHPQRVVLYRD